MAIYDMNMILEWAKVFPENMDMGDENSPQAHVRQLAKNGGQYIVNAYFTSEEDIEKLISEGLQTEVLGNPRIIEGNPSYGVGKFMKLKRKQNDVKTFTKKNGEEFTRDFGGAPNVVDLRAGVENKSRWSLEDEGSLGNGTLARVQFEVYGNGSGARLMNIGVLELVEYESPVSEVEQWAEVD